VEFVYIDDYFILTSPEQSTIAKESYNVQHYSCT